TFGGERAEIAVELEARSGGVGKSRLLLRDVGARDTEASAVRPAVDAHLDTADAIGRERPAGNMELGFDYCFAGRRIDRTDRAGRRERRSGSRRRRLRRR